MAADSLATAVSVLGPERGLALIESIPGAAVFVVRNRDDVLETFESRRFASYLTKKSPRPAGPASEGANRPVEP